MRKNNEENNELAENDKAESGLGLNNDQPEIKKNIVTIDETLTRGKIHEYLGMTINYSEDGKVKITSYDTMHQEHVSPVTYQHSQGSSNACRDSPISGEQGC
jgi:hypothetical protein